MKTDPTAFHGALATELSGGFITSRFGEKYLHAVSGNNFNTGRSDALYASRYTDKLFEPNTLFVIVGTDSGLLAEYILNTGVPSGSRYVFVELAEFHELIADKLRAYALPEEFTFCRHENFTQALKSACFAEYAYSDAVELVKSFAVEDGFHFPYRDLWRIVERHTTQVLWQHKTQFTSRIFAQRDLENLTENRIPAACLRGTFKGATAAVLAGGPSLDAFIPWILAHRSQLTVIAVSRICRQLLRLDLEPDIIVSVDPHPISFDVSRELLQFPEALLVNANHVTPLLLGNWPGRSVYLNDAFPWRTAGAATNIVGTGPTVTNSAITLAGEMGFAQVLLFGVDLCYSPEGYSHASGSNERTVGPALGTIGHTVTTNDGRQAETDNAFLNGTQALRGQAAALKKKKCRLLNPSGQSAAIAGVDYVPLADIVLDGEPRALLSAALHDASTRDADAHYTAVEQELRRAKQHLHQIKRLSKFAIGLYQFLQRQPAQFARQNKGKLLNRIEARLNSKRYKEFSRLAKIFGMVKFARLLRPEDQSRWTEQEIANMGQAFYDAYIFGADELLKVVNAALERVAVRREELSSTPDWERLRTQWTQDQQAGRGVLWCRRQGIAPADTAAPVAGILAELADAYQAMLANEDTLHVRRCKKNSQLTGIVGKALEAFNQSDSIALQRLLTGLTLHSDPAARPLLAFCQGLAAELDGDLDAAVTCYGEAEGAAVIEHVLARMAVIALTQEDYAHAVIALENLSGLSQSYLPKLADLQRMLGETQRAIDLYTEYLSACPEDLATMTKLGTLYQSLGVTESAQWIFDHVNAQIASRANAVAVQYKVSAA